MKMIVSGIKSFSRSPILHRVIARFENAFVSKHYQVNINDIKKLVSKNMKSDYRFSNDGICQVKICKLCDKNKKEASDNTYKLYIYEDGSYHCFRCSQHGSWHTLLKKTKNSNIDAISTTNDILNNNEKPIVPVNQLELFQFTENLFLDENKDVLEYLLKSRGLSEEILRQYFVGCHKQSFLKDVSANSNIWESEQCITFPWIVQSDILENKNNDINTFNEILSDIDDNNIMKSINENIESQSESQISKLTENHSSSIIPQLESANILSSDESAAATVEATTAMTNLTITRIKYRSIVTKGKQRLYPKGGAWGLFGWHLVKKSDTVIIITEGEFDAMAVAQYLKTLPDSHPMKLIPVVSLPNGCNSLPPDIIFMLEKFDKIYIWMDDDEAGRSGCEKFITKLGLKRCLSVTPYRNNDIKAKDANDALRQGLDIADIISKARPKKHEKILLFDDIRNELYSSGDNPMTQLDDMNVTQITSLTALNGMLNGFRTGEFVIVTGGTGSGKTTFLSQISLDFAKQGKAILWGSFEIQNKILIRKMLHQFAKKNVAKLPPVEKDSVYDEFSELPFVFLNYHGGTSIDQLLDTIDYAIHVYDIQYVIIDNLQFMIPVSDHHREESGNFDKFAKQDMIVSRLRKLATEKKIGVILVVHPRKEDERLKMSMASIFGSAKVTQEADAVMILQRNKEQTTLEVKKNRYNGELGEIILGFSKSTLLHYEDAIHKKVDDIEVIIDDDARDHF